MERRRCKGQLPDTVLVYVGRKPCHRIGSAGAHEYRGAPAELHHEILEHAEVGFHRARRYVSPSRDSSRVYRWATACSPGRSRDSTLTLLRSRDTLTAQQDAEQVSDYSPFHVGRETLTLPQQR